MQRRPPLLRYIFGNLLARADVSLLVSTWLGRIRSTGFREDEETDRLQGCRIASERHPAANTSELRPISRNAKSVGVLQGIEPLPKDIALPGFQAILRKKPGCKKNQKKLDMIKPLIYIRKVVADWRKRRGWFGGFFFSMSDNERNIKLIIGRWLETYYL
jgi:hypothetical protein